MSGSWMFLIKDVYHDYHLSTLTLCLIVACGMKFIGVWLLGGAWLGHRRPTPTVGTYALTL
jgi:hypothetical protein